MSLSSFSFSLSRDKSLVFLLSIVFSIIKALPSRAVFSSIAEDFFSSSCFKEILAEFYYSEGNFEKAEQYGKIIEKKEENYSGLIEKIMESFTK